MHKAIGLIDVAVSIPASRIQTQDLVKENGLSDLDRAAVSKFGIVSVAASDGDAFQLALTASEQVLRRSAISARALDAILYISPRLSERLLVAEGPRLQEALGAVNALTMSVTDLGCASSSAALFLAKSLLESNSQWDTILIAHGSVSATEARLRLPVTVNGDAGMALVVGREGLRARLLELVLETSGAFWDLFYVDYLEHDRPGWEEACSDRRRYTFDLSLRSKKLVTRMVVDRQPLLGDSYRLVVPNLSESSNRFYEEIAGKKVESSCSSNLRLLGHLGPIDVFANLLPLLDIASPGDKILMLNNSPVAWSAAVWETT